MTLRETIQNDGVVMKWIRTAATTITSVAAACGVIFWMVSWTLAPRFVVWADDMVLEATGDLRKEVTRTALSVDRLEGVVESLAATVVALSDQTQQLSKSAELSTAPSWRFSAPETYISDGQIGGIVTINAGGFKLRDCGTPTIDLYFQGSGKVYHRFSDVSLLGNGNRGIALPVNPGVLQQLIYKARIPEDDGVIPGRSKGYISVTYPDHCPSVGAEIAGPLQFRITGGSNEK